MLCNNLTDIWTWLTCGTQLWRCEECWNRETWMTHIVFVSRANCPFKIQEDTFNALYREWTTKGVGLCNSYFPKIELEFMVGYEHYKGRFEINERQCVLLKKWDTWSSSGRRSIKLTSKEERCRWEQDKKLQSNGKNS